jgi:hypothetical protein
VFRRGVLFENLAAGAAHNRDKTAPENSRKFPIGPKRLN